MLHDPDDKGNSSAPLLKPDVVNKILGKRLLVGLTYLRKSGDLIEQKQMHGIVERINQEEGIVIRLPDGAQFRLPPDLRGIEEATPGVYRLRSTGEEVQNPDYLCTWTITRPDA
jgi:hypothetical protein